MGKKKADEESKVDINAPRQTRSGGGKRKADDSKEAPAKKTSKKPAKKEKEEEKEEKQTESQEENGDEGEEEAKETKKKAPAKKAKAPAKKAAAKKGASKEKETDEKDEKEEEAKGDVKDESKEEKEEKEEGEKKTKRKAPAKKAKAPTKKQKKDDDEEEDEGEEKAPAKSAGPTRTGPKRAARSKQQEKDEDEDEDEGEEKEEKKKAPAKKAKAPAKKAKAAPKKKKGGEEGEKDDAAEDKEAAKEDKKIDTESTDLTTPTKSEGEIKILTWNVAGWRSVFSKGFEEYIKKENPDIICLQETKIEPDKVPSSVLSDYKRLFNCGNRPGHHGTGMFSKEEPISWTTGIGKQDHDEEGRVITAEYDKFFLVNCYTPNSGRQKKNLEYRQQWDKDFLEYLKKLEKKKPVIWCGDLNVAHQEIDLKNPKANKNRTAGFYDEERNAFSTVLKSGFVDYYRMKNPDETDCYTFWSYFKQAREKNSGWRLDYFVVSKKFVKNLSEIYRRDTITGSDHCPLILHVNPDVEDDGKDE